MSRLKKALVLHHYAKQNWSISASTGVGKPLAARMQNTARYGLLVEIWEAERKLGRKHRFTPFGEKAA